LPRERGQLAVEEARPIERAQQNGKGWIAAAMINHPANPGMHTKSRVEKRRERVDDRVLARLHVPGLSRDSAVSAQVPIGFCGPLGMAGAHRAGALIRFRAAPSRRARLWKAGVSADYNKRVVRVPRAVPPVS
jgi:hypothetical protein